MEQPVHARSAYEIKDLIRADRDTSPDASTRLSGASVLDGGDVLPGFRLPLSELFRVPQES